MCTVCHGLFALPLGGIDRLCSVIVALSEYLLHYISFMRSDWPKLASMVQTTSILQLCSFLRVRSLPSRGIWSAMCWPWNVPPYFTLTHIFLSTVIFLTHSGSFENFFEHHWREQVGRNYLIWLRKLRHFNAFISLNSHSFQNIIALYDFSGWCDPCR